MNWLLVDVNLNVISDILCSWKLHKAKTSRVAQLCSCYPGFRGWSSSLYQFWVVKFEIMAIKMWSKVSPTSVLSNIISGCSIGIHWTSYRSSGLDITLSIGKEVLLIAKQINVNCCPTLTAQITSIDINQLLTSVTFNHAMQLESHWVWIWKSASNFCDYLPSLVTAER